MSARFIVLDGCHGTGSSTHADTLAAALESALWTPRNPIVVRAYHHPRHPEGCNGVARIAWYAGARAQMLRGAAGIVVMDRGPLSGVVYAESLTPAAPGRSTALALARAELAREPWAMAPTVVLDAEDDALDARLRERGEDPAASHPERLAWGRLLAACGWAKVVRTDGDAGDVRAELLAWALREVGRDNACTCGVGAVDGHALHCTRVFGERGP